MAHQERTLVVSAVASAIHHAMALPPDTHSGGPSLAEVVSSLSDGVFPPGGPRVFGAEVDGVGQVAGSGAACLLMQGVLCGEVGPALALCTRLMAEYSSARTHLGIGLLDAFVFACSTAKVDVVAALLASPWARRVLLSRDAAGLGLGIAVRGQAYAIGACILHAFPELPLFDSASSKLGLRQPAVSEAAPTLLRMAMAAGRRVDLHRMIKAGLLDACRSDVCRDVLLWAVDQNDVVLCESIVRLRPQLVHFVPWTAAAAVADAGNCDLVSLLVRYGYPIADVIENSALELADDDALLGPRFETLLLAVGLESMARELGLILSVFPDTYVFDFERLLGHVADCDESGTIVNMLLGSSLTRLLTRCPVRGWGTSTAVVDSLLRFFNPSMTFAWTAIVGGEKMKSVVRETSNLTLLKYALTHGRGGSDPELAEAAVDAALANCHTTHSVIMHATCHALTLPDFDQAHRYLMHPSFDWEQHGSQIVRHVYEALPHGQGMPEDLRILILERSLSVDLLGKLLVEAARADDVKMCQSLLEKGLLRRSQGPAQAFLVAGAAGSLAVITMMLGHQRLLGEKYPVDYRNQIVFCFEPNAMAAQALLGAATGGHHDTVVCLLESLGPDDTATLECLDMLARCCVSFDWADVFGMLVPGLKRRPRPVCLDILSTAVRMSALHVLAVGLDRIAIRTAEEAEALWTQCFQVPVDVLTVLLKGVGTPLVFDFARILVGAAEVGLVDHVRVCLKHLPESDDPPCEWASEALRSAVASNHVEVVSALVEDGRADLLAANGAVFFSAVSLPSVACLAVLLEACQSRLPPSLIHALHRAAHSNPVMLSFIKELYAGL